MAKFLVEFTVDESWIEDGFEMTEDIATDMIMTAVPYSQEGEVSAKVFPQPAIVVTKTEIGDIQISVGNSTITHSNLTPLEPIVQSVSDAIEKHL